MVVGCLCLIGTKFGMGLVCIVLLLFFAGMFCLCDNVKFGVGMFW